MGASKSKEAGAAAKERKSSRGMGMGGGGGAAAGAGAGAAKGQGNDGPTAGDDFYQFVNHKWLHDPSVVIPEEYPRWGSFIQLVDESLMNQIAILKDVCDKEDPSEDEKKLAAVWKVSMQRFADWDAGKGDVGAALQELETLDETLSQDPDQKKGLADYLSRAQEIGIRYPFHFDKEANLDDAGNVVLDLGPSGLSLPSRDYYLEDNFAEQRAQYLLHLEKVKALVEGADLAPDFVTRVMRFETKLAQIQMKRDQSRKFTEYYTVTTLDDLTAKINSLKSLPDKQANYDENTAMDGDKDLVAERDRQVSDEERAQIAEFLEIMWTNLGLRDVLSSNFAKHYPEGNAAEAEFRMMVFDGDYFRRVFALLFRESNREDVRAYLQYKIIRSVADFCTKELNEEFFDFYARKIRGQKAQKTPEKRTVGLVSAWISELMGKIYVKYHFSEEDKTYVREMVQEGLDVMKDSIEKNDWLTAETKVPAKRKLEKMRTKIGYPDKWKDHSALDLQPTDTLFEMDQKVSAFNHQTEFLDKLNAPKDKADWEMSPADVNAYFHPLMNEIVFPAAIIQPPFYYNSVDQISFDLLDIPRDLPHLLDAVNCGGIMAVILHEISHSQDDQGKNFNAEGEVENWWTDEDMALFNSKCDLMGAQAEAYTFEEVPENGGEPRVHRMNPKLTMGENLADLGGLAISSRLLSRRFDAQGLDAAARKPLMQAMFMSWANVWKSKATKEFLVQQLATDPHAPTPFRANLVANIDAFYDAFGVKEGDGMYIPPDKRVYMW